MFLLQLQFLLHHRGPESIKEQITLQSGIWYNAPTYLQLLAITAMWCQQCLPLSVVQLNGRIQKPSIFQIWDSHISNYGCNYFWINTLESLQWMYCTSRLVPPPKIFRLLLKRMLFFCDIWKKADFCNSILLYCLRLYSKQTLSY